MQQKPSKFQKEMSLLHVSGQGNLHMQFLQDCHSLERHMSTNSSQARPSKTTSCPGILENESILENEMKS